jgi:hypothetical protein
MLISAVIGAIVGALGKEIVECLKLSYCGRRCHVQNRINELRSATLIDTKDVSVVPYYTIERCIDDTLEDQDGGVWIFGAPAGSGKTTYLGRQIQIFRSKVPKREIVIFPNGISVIRDKKINQLLGVPDSEPLSRYLPDGTVIVLEQFDISVSLSEETKEYILNLATDSRNSKKYSVIISVSNPETMIDLLKINGGEKVKDICHPNYIKWTSTEVSQYINEMFKDWTNEEKRSLIESCRLSYSPGVLFDAYKMKQSRRYSVDDVVKFAENLDMNKSKKWEEFNAILKNYPMYKPFIETK